MGNNKIYIIGLFSGLLSVIKRCRIVVYTDPVNLICIFYTVVGILSTWRTPTQTRQKHAVTQKGPSQPQNSNQKPLAGMWQCLPLQHCSNNNDYYKRKKKRRMNQLISTSYVINDNQILELHIIWHVQLDCVIHTVPSQTWLQLVLCLDRI